MPKKNQALTVSDLMDLGLTQSDAEGIIDSLRLDVPASCFNQAVTDVISLHKSGIEVLDAIVQISSKYQSTSNQASTPQYEFNPQSIPSPPQAFAQGVTALAAAHAAQDMARYWAARNAFFSQGISGSTTLPPQYRDHFNAQAIPVLMQQQDNLTAFIESITPPSDEEILGQLQSVIEGGFFLPSFSEPLPALAGDDF